MSVQLQGGGEDTAKISLLPSVDSGENDGYMLKQKSNLRNSMVKISYKMQCLNSANARTNRQCEDGAYCTIDCDNSGDNQCCLTELTRSCESKTREDACAHQVTIYFLVSVVGVIWCVWQLFLISCHFQVPIEEVTIEQKINELSFKYIVLKYYMLLQSTGKC